MARSIGIKGLGFHRDYKVKINPLFEYISCDYTLDFDDDNKNIIHISDLSGYFYTTMHPDTLPDTLTAYIFITLDRVNQDDEDGNTIVEYLESGIGINDPVEKDTAATDKKKYYFTQKSSPDITIDLIDVLLKHNAKNCKGNIGLYIHSPLNKESIGNSQRKLDFAMEYRVVCEPESDNADLKNLTMGDCIRFSFSEEKNEFNIDDCEYRLIIWDDISTTGQYRNWEWGGRPKNRTYKDLGKVLDDNATWNVGFDIQEGENGHSLIYPLSHKDENDRKDDDVQIYNYFSYALQIIRKTGDSISAITVFQEQDVMLVKFPRRPALFAFQVMSNNFQGINSGVNQYNATYQIQVVLWLINFSFDIESIPVQVKVYGKNSEDTVEYTFNGELQHDSIIIGHKSVSTLPGISSYYQPDEIYVTLSFPTALPDTIIPRIIHYDSSKYTLKNGSKEIKARDLVISHSEDYIYVSGFTVNDVHEPEYTLNNIQMSLTLPKEYIHSQYEGKKITLFFRIFVQREEIHVSNTYLTQPLSAPFNLKKVQIELTPQISRFIASERQFNFNRDDSSSSRGKRDITLTKFTNTTFSLYTTEINDRYKNNIYAKPIIEYELYLLDFNGNRI